MFSQVEREGPRPERCLPRVSATPFHNPEVAQVWGPHQMAAARGSPILQRLLPHRPGALDTSPGAAGSPRHPQQGHGGLHGAPRRLQHSGPPRPAQPKEL